MATRQRRPPLPPAPDEALFSSARARRVPFPFVLDELAGLAPYTKPMFGCMAIYVGDKIVFILRDRPTSTADNGVWVATTRDHHASLRAVLPSLRSIGVLGGGETGWQCIPAEDPDFEEQVLRACALVREGDARIGKVPKRASPRGRGAASAAGAREGTKAKRGKSAALPRSSGAVTGGTRARGGGGARRRG